MVACDNDSCNREWVSDSLLAELHESLIPVLQFHLGCVGLQEPPPPRAKWYCRDCAEQMGKKKKKGR